jgi:methionine synthase I (cobalamin-dependent)
MDGATGTLLAERGYARVPTPRANLERPDLVRGVARDYARAGAEIVTANSFGSGLERDGAIPDPRIVTREVVAALRLAREGVREAGPDHEAEVAASIAPLRPPGDGDRPPLAPLLEPVLAGLAEEKPDLVLVETQVDVDDAVEVVVALRRALPGVDVLAGMTLGDDGCAPDGCSPRVAARLLADAGAVPGVSCVPAAAARAALPAMLGVVGPPLWAKISVGGPGGRESSFAELVEELVEAGATFVGGCCGTRPEDVQAARQVLRSRGLPL